MKSLTKLEGMPLNIAITIASGAGFLLFGYDQGFFGEWNVSYLEAEAAGGSRTEMSFA